MFIIAYRRKGEEKGEEAPGLLLLPNVLRAAVSFQHRPGGTLQQHSLAISRGENSGGKSANYLSLIVFSGNRSYFFPPSLHWRGERSLKRCCCCWRDAVSAVGRFPVASPSSSCFFFFSIFLGGKLTSTSVKLLPVFLWDSTSRRQHDAEILCHLRHRHRVRSPPDRGDRPARGSSLSNNDPQPVKKGECGVLFSPTVLHHSYTFP